MIDDDQDPIGPPFTQGIMHEIHTPAFLWTGGHWSWSPMRRDMFVPPQFAHARYVYFFFEPKRLLGDSELPAEIAGERPALGLAESTDNLLIGEP